LEEEVAPAERLPMVFPFKYYYIRKCYHALVFYMYVYRKLRIKFPKEVFIVASFDKRELQSAYKFEPGNEKGVYLTAIEFKKSTSDYPTSIHFCPKSEARCNDDKLQDDYFHKSK
jgi:hypothetical protein